MLNTYRIPHDMSDVSLPWVVMAITASFYLDDKMSVVAWGSPITTIL